MALIKFALLSRLAVLFFVFRTNTFVGCVQINPLQQPDTISTFNVHNHYQCQRLCWYIAQCARYSFHSVDNAEGHNCVLHVNTGGEEELLDGWREEIASGTGLHSGHGCLRRPCSNTEMCIPVYGHDKSICVHYPNLLAVNQPSTTSLTTTTTSATSTVPVITTSTVPVTTTSTVPVTTTSTVPVTTTSTVPVTTTSTVPVTTTSTVPVTTTSTVPVTTTSTVPVTSISTVPVTTISTVPVTTISTVPVTTISTVPVTTISTVPVTTISTVPVTTTSTVPVTTTSTVPVTTTSTVPVTTISTVPVSTKSTVPVTRISTVPVTTISTVPVTTISIVPVTTTSTVPVIEKTCTMDQDCPAATNTDCYQGLCLCEFGFQYSVSQDSCVDFCDATDPALTTYLTYPGGGINGHNNYTTNGTPEECQAICANDSKCHNVERKMSSGRCHYSYAGPTPANWGPGSGWVLYQKNCA